jgi:hypothetical protein
MWHRDAVTAPWPSYPFCETPKDLNLEHKALYHGSVKIWFVPFGRVGQ